MSGFGNVGHYLAASIQGFSDFIDFVTGEGMLALGQNEINLRSHSPSTESIAQDLWSTYRSVKDRSAQAPSPIHK